MKLQLPYPPSANSYWRHPGKGPLAGRHLISEDGRKYRIAVGLIVRAARAAQGMTCRLSVDVMAFPPDRRKRDLDNLLKPLLDAMQHAGVYKDDSQIDGLRILRGEIVKGGHVAVEIEPIESAFFEAMKDR